MTGRIISVSVISQLQVDEDEDDDDDDKMQIRSSRSGVIAKQSSTRRRSELATYEIYMYDDGR